MSNFAGVKNESIFTTILRTQKLLLNVSKKLFFYRLLVSIFEGLAITGMMLVWKNFIDNLEKYTSGQLTIMRTATFFMVVFVISEIFMSLWNTLSTYINDLLKSRIERHITKQISEKCLDLPLEYFEVPELYDYINRAKEASLSIFNLITSQALILLITFRIMSLGIYLFSQNKTLLIVLFMAAIPSILAKAIRGKKMFKFHYTKSPESRKMDYYKECLVSKEYYKETRTLGISNYLINEWRKTVFGIIKHEWEINKKLALIHFVANILRYCGYAGAYCIAGIYLFRGEITIGMFVLLTGVMMNIQPLISNLLVNGSDIYEHLLRGKNYFDFMDITSHSKSNEKFKFSKNIILKEINYKYPKSDNLVLKDVNLTINKGESIAIVGKNGAGKSTLMKVITGLLSPTSGKVLYDNIDIMNIDKKEIIDITTSVFQNFNKYYLSLRENVGMGDIENINNLEAIKSALNKTDFDLSNEKFNQNGLETLLGREFDGEELSGGEWQKLAIARGCFKEHQIIFLDEPTASLDPLMETEILDRFIKLSKGKTTVIVTHRLGCVKYVDRIVVVDKGEIIEVGSHAELILKNGIYSEMFKAQSEWYQK